MFKNNKPSASVIDNRLILSLPNAATPVVWMMDLSDEGTFILRIDQNDNGFFVVQKISKDGKKIEDIAFYSNKGDAQKAMTLITNATSRSSHNGGVFNSLKKFFVRLVFLIALVFVCLVAYFNRDILFGIDMAPQMAAQSTQQSPNVTMTDNPDAVGIPMSADDFLNQPSNLLPF